MSESTVRRFILQGEAETRALGEAFSSVVDLGDLVCLKGPLGSGKTTWARGLIQARQRQSGDPEEIVSPTFTLVQNYETDGLTLFHYDLYRIEHEEEVVELGFEDALQEGAVIVEWPERLGSLIAVDRIEIVLSGDGAERQAKLIGLGSWAARLRIMVVEGVAQELRNE